MRVMFSVWIEGERETWQSTKVLKRKVFLQTESSSLLTKYKIAKRTTSW